MAFDYVETAQDAAEALAEAGGLTVVERKPATDDYDPATSGGTATASASVTAYGAIFDYAGRDVGTQPDSLIRAGDRQVLLAALDVDGAAITTDQIAVEGKLTAPDGETYIIKNVKPLAPAGVAVLFDINVRRG